MKLTKLRELIKRYKFLIILIIFLSLFLYFSLRYQILLYRLLTSPSKMSDIFSSLGVFGPIIMFFLVVIEVVIAPIPGFVFTVAGGLVFGIFWGIIIAWLGNFTGSLIAFLLSRKYGRTIIEYIIPKERLEKFDKFMKKSGGFVFFVARANPLTSYDILNYLAGLTKIKFRDFLIASAFAILPMIILLNYLGDNIISLNSIIYSSFLIISFAVLLISFYGLYITQKIRKKKYKKVSKIILR